MTEKAEKIFNATCVAVDKTAILLQGPSGIGKSDFAFRLIQHHGARLVSDDQVILRARDNVLYAAPHEQIKGLLELRGLGIVKLPYSQDVPVGLLVDLVKPLTERLPDPPFEDIAHIAVRRVQINPSDPLAVDKLLFAIKAEYL